MQNSFFTKLFPVFATKPDSMKTELMAGLTTFLTMAPTSSLSTHPFFRKQAWMLVRLLPPPA